MTLDLGRVVGVHPEDHSVDIVLVSNGARIPGVPVLAGAGSSSAGSVDLHDVEPAAEYWDNVQSRPINTFAAVGFFGGRPLVIGFLFPQVSEVLFKRTNFRVDRHPSDWYQTVDDAGNAEWSHPSGTFLRFAEDPEHEDLTGQDFDKKWAIGKNTTRAPWVSLLVANAGAEVARLRIDPSGNVTLTHSGNLTQHTKGAASIQVDGTASVHVNGTTSVTSGGAASVQAPSVTIDAPQTTMTGHVTVQGGLSVSGGSGASISGNLDATGGSFTHNGANVGSSHVHSDPQGGNTGTPH